MFAYLKGVFVGRALDYIIVDVNGVGYKVFMSENSMKKVGEIGNEVKVYTYMKVREDDISIYGFSSNEELKMFELLISVSGIGAKSAITILSNIEPSEFAVAIVSEDVGALKKLPGIGAKSSQRIILELKDKLKDVKVSNLENIGEKINPNEAFVEAMSALQVLGYTQKDIEAIEPKLDKTENNIEKLIKTALGLLSNI